MPRMRAGRVCCGAAGVGVGGEGGEGGKDEELREPHSGVEQAQVLVYRLSLIIAAVCWVLSYTLDFFMTGGIDSIDGNLQAMLLATADVSAGVAALLAPTGSRVLVGALLKGLGFAALAAAFLGVASPGGAESVGPGALAGPACIVLICAREIYWFGLGYKVDAAWALASFTLVLLLRASASPALGGAAPAVLVATEATPVGPPIPLSFISTASLFVLAFGKIFEPVGEDLDEEGEQWAKRSSVPLKGATKPLRKGSEPKRDEEDT